MNSFYLNSYIYVSLAIFFAFWLPAAPVGLVYAKVLSVFAVSFIVLWVLKRSYPVLVEVLATRSLTEDFLICVYKSIFSIFYALSYLYLVRHLDVFNAESVLRKGGFTVLTFNEVILLVWLLVLALVSYKRCLADAKRGTYKFIRGTVKAASWLFTVYWVFLIWPALTYDAIGSLWTALTSPSLAFADFKTISIYLTDDKAFYLIAFKSLLCLVSNYQLHLVGKYYAKSFVGHNFFVIIVLLLWISLFALGLDNMGIIIIIFDIASLCTAGLIVLCERPDENENSKKALFYFLVSIFTSLVAYVGIYFISTGHHSFSFTFYYLFNENGGSLQPLNGYAILGWFLIFIKVAFLLGAFPFYKIAVDVGTSLWFPAIYYWSVVSKIPAALFTLKFFCIAQMIDSTFFKGALLTILLASILYASWVFVGTPRLKTFFAYSSMVNIPYVLLFQALNWKGSVFLILINFSIYSVALFAVLLFISSSYKLEFYANVKGGNEIDTFESFLWTSQEIRFSKGTLNLGYSRDFLSALVKVPTAVSALVLMGAAPFSGFLLKYLIVSLFASSSSFFTCLVILLSSAITHLAYFNLFTNITERVCKYSGRSNNEWVLMFDEDDVWYFMFIFFFNIIAIFFLLALLFCKP